ncbi:MAG: hypothetical protein ACYDDB_01365 [bacterium]
MSIAGLINLVTDKKQFTTIDDYISFCNSYLKYIKTGLEARIVSQNENNYRFLQYKSDANHNITRPLNSNLMYFDLELFMESVGKFKQVLKKLKDGERPIDELRQNIIRTIYTIQQSIGAALDALPSGKSNQARKLNGDLFEHFIRLLIVSIDVDCVSGTMQVPVKDDNGKELFKSSYQHDLMISKDDELKIIGSVKTSSKDRIDKVFMDKFLYNKLTDTALPHIAIFLNDVQRKKTKKENKYGINATFLPGHFKAYTIKLNALDGVYYCDIRPNMVIDEMLNKYIKTIDHFFYTDLWELLNRKGQTLDEIAIKKNEDNE